MAPAASANALRDAAKLQLEPATRHCLSLCSYSCSLLLCQVVVNLWTPPAVRRGADKPAQGRLK